MTLPEVLEHSYFQRSVLIIGRPASGKTWLSNALSPMYPHHHVIHTDSYKDFSEPVAIQALIEDAYENKPTIIEGMLSYPLLLQGAKEQSYRPDIVIEVEISAGKQRELYLAERNPDKIKYLKKFHMKTMAILDEYYKLVPESEMPTWLILENKY